MVQASCWPWGTIALAILCACSRPEAIATLTRDARTELGQPTPIAIDDIGFPIVEVELAAAGRARFLVDTGMEVTLLDEAFARRAGLALVSVSTTLVVRTPNGDRKLERAAIVPELRVAGCTAHDLTPPVTDLAPLFGGVQGVLGEDVLADWAVFFDGPGKRLVLLPSEELLKRLGDYLPKETALEAVPLLGSDRMPRISFDIRAAGRAIEVMVDTGSNNVTLPPLAIAALFPNAGTPTESTTLARVSKHDTWKVNDFPIGARRVPTVVEASESDVGLLGWSALRQLVFVVDAPGRRLLVAQTPQTR